MFIDTEEVAVEATEEKEVAVEEVAVEDFDLEDFDEFEEEEEVEEEEQKEEKVVKTPETLEAKEARLKRQLKVTRKQLGIVEEPVKKEKSNSQDTLSREEAKLYAKGLTDDQVDKVAQIAKIEGITLDEAVNSDYYTVWTAKQEKEVKQEKSQLRASRGGKVVVKKTLDTPGLTDAEHKALWNE